MSGRVSRVVCEGSPGQGPGPRSHEHHALPLTESVRSDHFQAGYLSSKYMVPSLSAWDDSRSKAYRKATFNGVGEYISQVTCHDDVFHFIPPRGIQQVSVIFLE